ncbi:MAG: dephospho-CoA kinase [Ignavibacteria bacterium]
MRNKVKIAITGGIGSGKTEFRNCLKEKGYPVISADYEAKQILINNPLVRKKIINAFGENSYTKTGVNTKYLAETVFSDTAKVMKINEIVHPAVIKHIVELMDSFLKENKFVFVEAALIYEAEMEALFDYVVLITSDETEKIKRLTVRDNTGEEDIRQIMANQIPDETKKGWADFVFDNNAGLPELHAKADFLITILKSMSEDI